MAKFQFNKLNIWMNGEYVGYWQKKSGVDELHYDNNWITNSKGRALSLSLPFTPGNQKHRGDKVKSYFDNLLPENMDIRERMARNFSSRSTSPFDLLAEIGRDCVGAIQLLPENITPPDTKLINCKPLTDSEVARILRQTVQTNQFGEFDSKFDLRLSLAGMQEKTALTWHENQWCLPIDATPTTHIFKLPLGLVGAMQADMHSSVENEWLCSKILEEFGLPVASCDIGLFEDVKALIVKRFDRKLSSNKQWIIRLPQEDMCQVKGISPLNKYQVDGGLGITDCMQVLDGSANSTDKQTFFASQIIFWLLYATDGHCKNFSIRHFPNNEYELTPFYDILSAHPIIGPKNNQIAKQKAKLAMAIRGNKNYYHIYNIQKRHFIQHAKSCGITPSRTTELISNIISQTEQVVNNIYKLIPDCFPKEIADSVLQGLLSQSKQLSVQPD